MDKKKLIITGLVVILIAYKFFFPGLDFLRNKEFRLDESGGIRSEEGLENEEGKLLVENKLDKKEEVENKRVYITGAIANPGIVKLEEDMRLDDAIRKLGGLSAEADINRINLAVKLEDGNHYIIPKIGEEVQLTDATTGSISTGSANSSDSRVNINTADASELDKIPGVGPATAEKIIKYRETEGKFSEIEDIKNVSGIGEKKFENMKDSIKCN